MDGARRYRFGEFTLDLRRGALMKGQVELPLRPKSFAVLQALVERHGELVTKDELLERVWGRAVVSDGAITQCLIDIRRAIGDESQEIIRTVPRRGYLFAATVTPADAEPAAAEATRPTPLSQPSPVRVRPLRRVLAAVVPIPLIALVAWSAATLRQEPTPAPQVEQRPAVDARKSIAVLPFIDLTEKADGEYLADGIAEEVLHLLVEGDGLRVIARTSSFAFKDRATSIQDIAAKLRVDYVVEGSVRKSGASLRITAQLIDAASSSAVWSKVYERDERGVVEVQQDIADHIATALQSSLRNRPRAATHVPDPAAHDAFLRARFLHFRRMPGDLDKAEQAYQEALRLDPRFARAWVGLAGVYCAQVEITARDVTPLLQKQKAAIDAAIALDPQLAEARIELAWYYSVMGEAEKAMEQAAIARALAPDDPAVLHWRWLSLAWDGHLDEAIEIQRRIVASDPVARLPRQDLATILLAAGRLDEARAEFLNFVDMGAQPDPEVAVDLARIQLLSGQYPEALRAAEQWARGADRDFVLAIAGDALDRQGLARAAESRLQAGASPAHAVRLAEMYAHRGDRDQARHWMDVAYDRLGANPWLATGGTGRETAAVRLRLVCQLKWSPFLRSLRADVRGSSTAG